MARGLDMLPEHMRESVRMWVDEAQPHPRLLGSCLRAILCNNLVDAFANADEENAAGMRGWAMWLYNDCPSQAWGSEERLQAWHDAHRALEVYGMKQSARKGPDAAT